MANQWGIGFYRRSDLSSRPASRDDLELSLLSWRAGYWRVHVRQLKLKHLIGADQKPFIFHGTSYRLSGAIFQSR
jgi:hypothetical protein